MINSFGQRLLGVLPGFMLLAVIAYTAGLQGLPTKTEYATSPDGVRIAYEVHGSGQPALVFVHGWSCNRGYWAAQIEPFSKRYTVVAIDLAGHGDSGINRKDWTISAYGADVAAVVKKLDLKKVILIGHSMGGDVIPEAALLLPGRVVGLIWVDTYKKLGQGRTPEEVDTFAAKFSPDFSKTTQQFVRSMFVSTSDPALVDRVANTMSSAPPSIAIPSLRSAFGYSRQMPATLERLRLPVVAINPDNAATDVASLNHYGVQVMIMPGVGHFEMMEDPARFNELLTQALAQVSNSKIQ